MPRHHYVPQFMLEGWADNGQLQAFSWNAGAKRVLNQPVAVRKACQVEDLNAAYGASRPKRNIVEDTLKKEIDTPASAILMEILSKGVEHLSDDQRWVWARFLLAFAVRTPETLREMGPAETRNGFASAARMASTREEREFMDNFFAQQMPALERNVPLNIALDLTADSDHIASIMAMDWWIRRFDSPKVLLGDRPLLSRPRSGYPCGIPLDCPSCMISLPISPKVLFCASPDRRIRAQQRIMQSSRILRLVNDETIACAVEYVYSAYPAMADMIVKGLTPQKYAEASNDLSW
jgi:hypothetical protein